MISIRDKMIDKVVKDMYKENEDKDYPIEIINVLASMMKEGKIEFVRKDGQWAFYLATKEY